MQVYTIGFARESLEQFVLLLGGARVQKLIDVRLRPASQLSGFARRDDLAFILRSYEGIAYQHEPRLAPTAEILDGYRRSRDWVRYSRQFRQLLRARRMAEVLQQASQGHNRVALLCSEAAAAHCHRRLIAEAYARSRPEVTVTHLE